MIWHPQRCRTKPPSHTLSQPLRIQTRPAVGYASVGDQPAATLQTVYRHHHIDSNSVVTTNEHQFSRAVQASPSPQQFQHIECNLHQTSTNMHKVSHTTSLDRRVSELYSASILQREWETAAQTHLSRCERNRKNEESVMCDISKNFH